MIVLWFSSRFFSEKKVMGTATWLDAMAEILMKKENVKLYNILNQIYHLLGSHVPVFSSYIESYGVAVAESLELGIPTITSYAGALSEQGKDGESILFFPMGDENSCASSIHRVFADQHLANELSIKAKKKLMPTLQEIADLQVCFYQTILDNTSFEHAGTVCNG